MVAIRWVSFIALLLFCCQVQGQSLVDIVDFDQDKMDDNWELRYGFDPSDFADGWEDWDCDGVINLFEYQLGTDPLDATSPTSIEISPDQINDTLRFLQEFWPVREPLHIKLTEGEYFLKNHIWWDRREAKVMIQGGWDEAYTEYNPEENITILDGDGWRRTRFAISEAHTVVILDGVSMTRWRTGLSVSNGDGDLYCSVRNCHFYDNNNSNIDELIGIRANGRALQLDIINSTFAHNHPEVLWVGANEDNERIHCRILNSSFVYNNKPDELWGIISTISFRPSPDLFSSAELLSWDIQNTIIWGNRGTGFYFGWEVNDLVELNLTSSIIETFPREYESYNVTEQNLYTFDPQIDSISYRPLPGSPCIDGGIDVGLPFAGSAPDVGAYETDYISPPKSTPSLATLRTFPNPVHNQAAEVRVELKASDDIELLLFNSKGQLIRTILATRLPQGTYNLPVHLHDLAAGVYYLHLKGTQQTAVEKLIVQ